jgi:hypothetical protein
MTELNLYLSMQQSTQLRLVFREELKSRFQDFRKHETSFRIFASPFEVDVEAEPEKFHVELIELRSREEIK